MSMSCQQASSAVRDLLLGEHSVPVRIRSGQGVGADDAALLVAAFEELVRCYRADELVPKWLALACVDIAVRFENRFLSSDEQDRMEDLGLRLQALAEELFAPPLA